MRNTNSFFLLLATGALFFSANAAGQTPAIAPGQAPNAAPPAQKPYPPTMARVSILMVSMPEEKLLTYLPDLLDKDKIEKVIPVLLEAVKRKEITLEGYPMVVTKSGQRAVMATDHEIEDPAAWEHSYYYMYHGFGLPGYTPVTPTTPTSFEVRHPGIVLEVEPVLGPDGTRIDLNLAPQHVEVIGEHVFTTQKDKDIDGADGKDVHIPVYSTAKVTTSLTLRSGQHALLGVFKKEKPEGTVEIFIVGADIVAASKENFTP